MKTTKTAILVIFCTATIGGLFSCKPSEKHYREAYETTIKARHSGEEEYLDSTARAAMQTGGRPAIMHVGDTILSYRVEWIRPVIDKSSTPTKPTATDATPGRPSLSGKPFCIIVGQFKQRFNAREMCARLQGYGYQNAMVFQNSEPRYFVAADTVSSPENAIKQLDAVKSDQRLMLKEPFPTIIQPAQRGY